MDAHRQRLATTTLLLIGASVLLLLAIGPDDSRFAAIGFILGTMFGQTTLAAAWTAFGPFPFLRRLPLALGWVCLLDLALCVRMAAERQFEFRILGIITICMIGQWLLVQIPFWVLVWTFGWQLEHSDEVHVFSNANSRQFGIRQLMIFTALVGLFLGISRIALTQFAAFYNIQPNDEMAITFLFLTTCAILITLPLVLAGLMPRLAIPAFLALLVVVGITTMLERDVLSLLIHKRGQIQLGPDFMHLVWINFFTCGWQIIFIIAIRWNGYYLMPAPALTSKSCYKSSN